MKVMLGEYAARCQNCGGTDFGLAHASSEQVDPCDLVCKGCGCETTRGSLMLQIDRRALQFDWQAPAHIGCGIKGSKDARTR